MIVQDSGPYAIPYIYIPRPPGDILDDIAEIQQEVWDSDILFEQGEHMRTASIKLPRGYEVEGGRGRLEVQQVNGYAPTGFVETLGGARLRIR